MMDLNKTNKVQVLLSAYNGETFIGEQLQSLYNQEGVDVSLLVRDDGSSDSTCAILDAEQVAGRLTWYAGENLKPAFSFWNLLQKAPSSPYYAFCDQDDVWDTDKLKIAVSMLSIAGDTPALYFSQTRLVDSSLNEISSAKISPLLTFGESLIYHFVTGCTVVMNTAMRDVLLRYTPTIMPMHDMWSYVVAQAVGAKIFFDSNPHISYRQHDNNVLGMKTSLLSIWKDRIARVRKNECVRSCLAKELLVGYADVMSTENLALTKICANYKQNLRSWMNMLFAYKFKSASSAINITSRIAVLLRIF